MHPSFFLGGETESIISRHCGSDQNWLAERIRTSISCTSAMAQTLLYIYQILHKERRTIHIVHLMDWEDQAGIITLGDAPAQWTVYCVQFPKSQSFHLDTAAWHCRNKTTIPWQPAPTLSAYDGIDAPFVNSNQNCIWFAFPHGPRGHYVVGHRHIGTFRYTGCIPCLLSWLVAKVTCKAHTSSTSYPELSGVMFVDQTGHVAVAADHDWQVYNTADFPTCLVIATIDQRLFRYTEHAHSLPAVNPIGTVTNELCNDWHRDGFPPSVAYFLCTLTTSPQ